MEDYHHRPASRCNKTWCFEQQHTIWLPRNWLVGVIVVGSCAAAAASLPPTFFAGVLLSVAWTVVLGAVRLAEEILLGLDQETVDGRAAVSLWLFALIGGMSYCASSGICCLLGTMRFL